MSRSLKDLVETTHFGWVGRPPAPISDDDDPDPDDEEFAVSPPDVVAMLGFDPKELNGP
jgi:hypothetical protein